MSKIDFKSVPSEKAFTASAYGKLRALCMAPPLRWSNAKFTEVFGSKASGSRFDAAQKIKEAYRAA